MTKKPNGRAAKRQYWQQMVIDWELGDFKTQDEFCQHAGISRKSLGRWLHVFRQERQTLKPAMGFSTVHVRNEPRQPSGVRIALHHGAYIDVYTDFDTDTLQRVLGLVL